MICTRPDIRKSLENPSAVEWILLKHLLRYLKGSIDNGLIYKKSKTGLSLAAYCDSDWASSEDRRSTTGYLFVLNSEGPPISWKSRKQQTIALSSCEAEYMALVSCVQEACFLLMLLRELINISTPIIINEDNQGAISLVKNPTTPNRSKHIDVKHHFIREKYNEKVIDVVYTPTDQNIADIFTKSATKNKLMKFRNILFGI